VAEAFYARLYFDEDVDVLVARLLLARGFDVLTTRDAGLLGADDEAQFAFAARTGRALVTHNRIDFERIVTRYAEAGRSHAGCIIVHRRDAHEIARRMMRLLDAYTAEELSGTLRYS
jgi:predicted nuclease of predicted toxin-antitoxin system